MKFTIERFSFFEQWPGDMKHKDSCPQTLVREHEFPQDFPACFPFATTDAFISSAMKHQRHAEHKIQLLYSITKETNYTHPLDYFLEADPEEIIERLGRFIYPQPAPEQLKKDVPYIVWTGFRILLKLDPEYVTYSIALYGKDAIPFEEKDSR